MNSKFLRHPAVCALLDELDGHKETFISDTVAAIEASISRKNTPECLGLIARDKRGNVVRRYPARISAGYASALLMFCLQLPYRKEVLDSKLTSEIVKIFQAHYEKHLKMHNKDVAAAVMSALASDKVVARKVVSTLLSSKGLALINKEMKKGLRDQIIVALSHKACASPVADVVAGKIAAGATAVAATQVGQILVQKLLVILIHNIGYIVTKALAVPAVKIAIAVALKKVVAAAVIAAFLKVFAAKVGIGIGSMVLIIIVPIVLGLLAKEWYIFPQKLGRSLALSLKEEISISYRNTNEVVLGEIWDYLLSKGVGEIESSLAGSEEMAELAGLARKCLTV